MKQTSNIPRHSSRLLKMKEVTARTSLSRWTIYREIERGNLSKGIPISPGRVGYPVEEIDALVAGKLPHQQTAE